MCRLSVGAQEICGQPSKAMLTHLLFGEKMLKQNLVLPVLEWLVVQMPR
jgi:hypothetical protein